MMLAQFNKTFRPSVMATVVLILLAFLFAVLGHWQSQRADEKTAMEIQFAMADVASLTDAIDREMRFAHIEVSGHYDSTRHILLDNQVWHGQAGVHVFTPFRTTQGSTILVNRGWLPLAADRSVLPDIPTPEHETVLRGILNHLPKPGRVLGQADTLQTDHWPQLVTYLGFEDISAALDVPLTHWVIQLSRTENDGFDGRDWRPVFLTSNKHKAYAFQWNALSLASIILWILNGTRRAKGHQQ